MLEMDDRNASDTQADLRVAGQIMTVGAAPRACQWYAAYTSANHEKRAAAHLDARGVEYFFPTYSSLRRWKDRRVQLELPLFPGYVFVRVSVDDQLRVLEVPGVARFVGFNGRPCSLPELEIERLRAGIAYPLRIVPHPYLTVGSRVRVKRGPLEGLEGVLLRRKKHCRVVLSLELIARSVSIEINAEDVERIEQRRVLRIHQL